MPRVCTICRHPRREGIDRALVAGEALRDIAGRFAVSKSALERHKAEHLPPALTRAQEADAEAAALDVLAELRRCLARVNLLFDACDAWLRDPEDPARYDLGPRAEDLAVIYTEPGPDGRPVRRKAPLAELLARVERDGRAVAAWETRHADPRELTLKTAARLEGHLTLAAKLLGELDERPTINVLLSPEWVALRGQLLTALAPYPEARAALGEALQC